MKGIAKTLLAAGLALLGLAALNACTTPPITIPLDDVTVDLQAAVNTGGRVVFPKEAQEFTPPAPGTSIASVVIRGKASLKSAADIGFTVYVTDQKPSDIGCTLVGELYACDAGNEQIEKASNEVKFDNETGPKDIEIQGERLINGINQGWFYLGALITGTGTVGNELYLTNLTATVQVNIGK